MTQKRPQRRTAQAVALAISLLLILSTAGHTEPADAEDVRQGAASRRWEDRAMPTTSRRSPPFQRELIALAWAPWALVGIGIAFAMACQTPRRREPRS